MKREPKTTDAKRNTDMDIIQKIADRAFRMYTNMGERTTRRDILMDIMAVHFKSQPLRLQEFLDADNFNFMHDIIGINQHLDRMTYELKDHFLPRYARMVP